MYYQAPLYRLLAEDPRLDFTALFASSGGVTAHDHGFGQSVVWDVDVLSGYRSEFLARADKNPIDGPPWALRGRDAYTKVRARRFEVLWLHGYVHLTHALAAVAQRRNHGRLMYREEQTLLHERGRARGRLKELLIPRLFASTYALYIGTENRRWFERWGVPAERQVFVPYVVDNNRIRRQVDELRPAREHLLAKIGIKPGTGPVIVCVGRLVPKKDHATLIRAFAAVRATQACHLVLTGSGPLEEELRSLVEQQRIPDVHFTGFVNQSEIAEAYVVADVFALASKEHETWGLVVNEAMAAGLPVVVTRTVGSSTDLVDDGMNGYVVEPGDIAALTRALGLLVADPDLRAMFSARSRVKIEAWTPRHAADGVLEAVADAVGPERWARASERVS